MPLTCPTTDHHLAPVTDQVDDFVGSAIRRALADGANSTRLAAAIIETYGDDLPEGLRAFFADLTDADACRDGLLAIAKWPTHFAGPSIFAVAITHWGEARSLITAEDDWRVDRTTSHPDAPVEMLDLCMSNDGFASHSIAKNPSAPPQILSRIVDGAGCLTFSHLAKNPNAPVELLERMAVHSSKWAREAVARCPKLSESSIRVLSSDRLTRVRQHVALNSSTPLDVVQDLSHDRETCVRRSAKAALRERGKSA